MSLNQKLRFGTQISLSAASFTGSAVLIGALQENPSIIFFKNDTNKDVFLADNSGAIKGVTLTAGEKWIIDCVTNADKSAETLQFSKGTAFYATAAAGTGSFRIGVLTAE